MPLNAGNENLHYVMHTVITNSITLFIAVKTENGSH